MWHRRRSKVWDIVEARGWDKEDGQRSAGA